MTTRYRFREGVLCLHCQERPPWARGVCQRCYQRAYHKGNDLPSFAQYEHMTIHKCKRGHLIEGSNVKVKRGRHLCRKCFNVRRTLYETGRPRLASRG